MPLVRAFNLSMVQVFPFSIVSFFSVVRTGYAGSFIAHMFLGNTPGVFYP
jgi:hypothetical protein